MGYDKSYCYTVGLEASPMSGFFAPPEQSRLSPPGIRLGALISEMPGSQNFLEKAIWMAP